MQDIALTGYTAEGAADFQACQKVRSGFYTRAGKRLFDTGLALFLLPVLAPVIFVFWAILRCNGGSGFFGHTRIGLGGKTFTCWKLRSMVTDAESRLDAYLNASPEAAAEWERDCKLTNDPRITWLGRFLRRTSLDELPQVWNVLKGEMSFVGSRPIVSSELAKYGRSAGVYLAQMPGMTGLWQVSGRNDISYEARVALDADYLARRSFALDLKIIARTANAVFGRTGR